MLVGFAAETGDDAGHVLDHARAKLERKGCDLLVVNDVGRSGCSAPTTTAAVILAPTGDRPSAVEASLADAIWDQWPDAGRLVTMCRAVRSTGRYP